MSSKMRSKIDTKVGALPGRHHAATQPVHYLAVLFLLAASASFAPAWADKPAELNLYSARHYHTDEALYNDFTKTTGIKINRIEASDNALIERLKSEGAKVRPMSFCLWMLPGCGVPKQMVFSKQRSPIT